MPDEPTTPPASDWSAFEQAGITPDKADEVVQAYHAMRDLNSLDRRPQALQQLIRPDLDGQVLRQLTGQQEAEPDPPDPWAGFQPPEPQPLGYDAAGNPVYEQPPGHYTEPASFDPRSLQPVFDQYGNQIEERTYRKVMDDLQRMALDQNVRDSAASAVRDTGLPPALAGMVEQQVRDRMQTQPNARAEMLAAEVAQSLRTELMTWSAAPPANPAPTSPVPGGPTPSMDELPKSFEEAARISAEQLSR